MEEKKTLEQLADEEIATRVGIATDHLRKARAELREAMRLAPIGDRRLRILEVIDHVNFAYNATNHKL
jgi:hypothetical protein